jgi:hypothetical protein
MVRKNIVPLPGDSTLDRKFGFIHVSQGLIEPAIAYLRQRVPRMTARETLAGIAFDEMNLKASNIHSFVGSFDILKGDGKTTLWILFGLTVPLKLLEGY